MTLLRRTLEIAAWSALVALLAAGLPLFVCMPPWLDSTLYDVAARTVLRGGVPYRDAFDTNLPGPLWIHLLVRSTLGYRSEVLRVVDAGLVGATILLLVQWLRPLGLSRAARVGVGFVLCAFYLSTPELCHCQRDVWMLLPALAALHLRRRQFAELTTENASLKRLALRGIGEGLFWALAFWIKPFVAVPALICWLAAALLARRTARIGRLLAVDAGSVLLGGLAAGGAGVGWMIVSGAWEPFLHIVTVWNPEYAADAQTTPLRERVMELCKGHFRVWDGIHLAAVPLALLTVCRGLFHAEGRRSTTILLAGFYLGWVGQVIFLQRMHEYIFVPPILIGLTFVAGFVATMPRPSMRLAATLGLGAFVFAALTQHPMAQWDRLSLWPRCWREGSTPELRNRLSLVKSVHTPDWIKLEEVAEQLRGLDVHDRELTCYGDSTHPIYLILGLDPSTPFLHYGLLLRCCPNRSEDIRDALARSPQRYVVSDLQDMFDDPVEAAAEAAGQPNALPPKFPAAYRGVFPWTEPIIFRSGRYLIHRVSGPVAPLLPPPRTH